MVRTPRADSALTRLLYWSRYWMRPNVPKPTAKMKKKAHVEVTTRPIGKKANAVPGTTKGSAEDTAADADAAAWGSALVGAVPALEKMPLTKDASWEDRVVSTSWPVTGFFAARSICGIRRGLRDSLRQC